MERRKFQHHIHRAIALGIVTKRSAFNIIRLNRSLHRPTYQLQQHRLKIFLRQRHLNFHRTNQLIHQTPQPLSLGGCFQHSQSCTKLTVQPLTNAPCFWVSKITVAVAILCPLQLNSLAVRLFHPLGLAPNPASRRFRAVVIGFAKHQTPPLNRSSASRSRFCLPTLSTPYTRNDRTLFAQTRQHISR